MLTIGTMSEYLPVRTFNGLPNGGYLSIDNNNYQTGSNLVASPDGFTWTTVPLPVADLWIDIQYVNNKFVILSQYGQTLVSSDYGNNWTAHQINVDNPMYGQQMVKMITNGQILVAIAYYDSHVYTSSDGQHWKSRDLGHVFYGSSGAYGGGYFIVPDLLNSVDNGGPTWIYFSQEGVLWDRIQTPDIGSHDFLNEPSAAISIVNTAISGDKLCLSTNQQYTIATTLPLSSGSVWHGGYYGYSYNVVGPIGYPGGFVAVSASSTGTVLLSNDGYTWNVTNPGPLQPGSEWGPGVYGDKIVWMGGSFNNQGNVAAVSTDGVTWSQPTLPLNSNWVGLAYISDPTKPSSNNGSPNQGTMLAYLKFNTTDGSADFVDQYGHIVNNFGSPVISSNVTVTSGNAGYFPTISGAQSFIRVLNDYPGEFDFGTGDFTIDFYTTPGTGDVAGRLANYVDVQNNTAVWQVGMDPDLGMYFEFPQSSRLRSSGSYPLTTNNTRRFTVTRSSGWLYMFMNGFQVFNGECTQDFSVAPGNDGAFFTG